jgi:uncharacterized protein
MALKSLQLIKQFQYDPRYDIKKTKIFYIDRGAPDDVSLVHGADLILSDSKFYFSIKTGNQLQPEIKFIPYHRIFRIEYDDKCMFERLTISAADQNLVFGR